LCFGFGNGGAGFLAPSSTGEIQDQDREYSEKNGRNSERSSHSDQIGKTGGKQTGDWH
jgi:hypothetical protein